MIVAICYQYSASDTVTASSGADAGGNYDMDNCKNANLTLRGRNTTPNDFYGMQFTLAANITLNCAELTNSTLTGAEYARMLVYSDAAASVLVYNTGQLLFPTPAAYNAHAYLEDVPSRQNAIVGIDFAGTGPTLTGSLSSVSARAVVAQFLNKSASRTFWELGYMALGTNGATITAPTAMSIRRIALRHGWGWRSEVRWDYLPMNEATKLESLKAATHDGSLPCFIFPYPGTRDASGHFVDPNASRTDETYVTPGSRGGLSRILDFGYSLSKDTGIQPRAVDATLSFESWQEVPTGS